MRRTISVLLAAILIAVIVHTVREQREAAPAGEKPGARPSGGKRPQAGKG